MIIAIDGPAAAGKGTLSRMLAEHFDLARLDTGLIYRAVAKKALELEKPNSEESIVAIAQLLVFSDLDKKGLRDENVGAIASEIAVIPGVRKMLLHFQRNFAKNPPNGKLGAVLDGRDIGTVVYPNADFKLFVTASIEVRARRRYKELQDRGDEAIRSAVHRDIMKRDERDRNRFTSPLIPAEDAHILETSMLDSNAVFKQALNLISLKK